MIIPNPHLGRSSATKFITTCTHGTKDESCQKEDCQNPVEGESHALLIRSHDVLAEDDNNRLCKKKMSKCNTQCMSRSEDVRESTYGCGDGLLLGCNFRVEDISVHGGGNEDYR